MADRNSRTWTTAPGRSGRQSGFLFLNDQSLFWIASIN
ncbi:hypothetical protein LEP1GSC005_3278 [Leptospira santarosai str. ST188]|nr:hypothetical protein LEP1GSC005_3278 [Leptospira santarosai str. ST188]